MAALDKSAVAAELAAILSSDVFARPERLRRFLRFVVEETIAGRELNEYRIAIEVYDRKSDFDPVTDSIVRVEVGRLRQRLADYYRTEGRDRPLVIAMQPRTYTPVFRAAAPVVPDPGAAPPLVAPARRRLSPKLAWFSLGAAAIVAVIAIVATVPLVRRGQATTSKTASIAVLPFADLSRAKDQSYLADGLSEEIIDALSRVPGLGVISRTSSFAYRDKTADIRKIGKDLEATAIVEGSVRTQDGRLRITAQLIDVASGHHLWSQTYERSMTDAFAVEEEIASGIATALRGELGATSAKPGARHTPTLGNYAIFLEGVHYAREWSADDLGKAIERFEQAVAADPSFAAAWAELAETRTVLAIHAGFPPEAVMPQAKSDALRALELDDSLPMAHAALGLVAGIYEWRWDEARKHLVRAHDLAPSDGHVHEAYIMGYLVPSGNLDEALRQANEALRYDPASPRISSIAAMVHGFRKEPDEAVTLLRKTLEIDPHFYAAHLAMGSVYAAKGMYPQAIEEIRIGRSAWESGVGRSALASLYARMGRRDEARALLNELIALSNRRYVSATYIAQIYLAFGDRTAALDWLDKAYEQRSAGLALLKVSPRFDALRTEPRFIALMKKVGFV